MPMPNQQAFHYRNPPPKPKGVDVIAAKLGLHVKEDSLLNKLL